MPVDMSGDWNLLEHDGAEAYYKSLGALGFPEEQIKAMIAAKPPMIIKQTGDDDFSVTSGIQQETRTFTVGQPRVGEMRGHKNTTIAKWEGDKLILTTTSVDATRAGREHITTREIIGGKLVQKAYLTGGPVLTTKYEKA